MILQWGSRDPAHCDDATATTPQTYEAHVTWQIPSSALEIQQTLFEATQSSIFPTECATSGPMASAEVKRNIHHALMAHWYILEHSKQWLWQLTTYPSKADLWYTSHTRMLRPPVRKQWALHVKQACSKVFSKNKSSNIFQIPAICGQPLAASGYRFGFRILPWPLSQGTQGTKVTLNAARLGERFLMVSFNLVQLKHGETLWTLYHR